MKSRRRKGARNLAPVRKVLTRTRADYGESFDAHVLEQYRLFVDTEERLVSRRQEENRFFLTVNALLVTVISLLIREDISDREAAAGMLLLAIAGMVLCYAWRAIIESYKTLNTAKFEVINALEAQLPARMFAAEWEAAERAEYQPFTEIERRVPIVFGSLFLAAAVVAVLGFCDLV